MALYQFKLLKEQEQYSTTWEKGVLIDARMTDEYKFLLYKIDEFYVEIKYNGDTNRIEGLKSFNSVMPLKDYLNLN
jgi:hypothetical protein